MNTAATPASLTSVFSKAHVRWESASRALYRAEVQGKSPRTIAYRRERERDAWTAREHARRAAGIPAV